MTVLSEPPRVKELVIVCLEDDYDLALLIEMSIRAWTCAFHTAYDGIHGLDLIRQEQPDLVLLDLNLPGLSGLEVFDYLQADPELRHIPVIVLSASRRDISATRTRYPLERAAAYLTKPFSVSELRDLLRAYLTF